MVEIFTHRGLDPSKENYFTESTLEAFHNQLERGFSLEVDLNFTKNGIVLCHDADSSRLSKGRNKHLIKDISTQEACEIKLPKGRLATFEELINTLRKYPTQKVALHFKGSHQNNLCCDTFIRHIKPFLSLAAQLLVFDLSPAAAKYIKNLLPELNLAASVSHPFDIERFKSATKGTLISLEQLFQHEHLYNWAWLDEWDLTNKRSDGSLDRRGKKLYTAEIFSQLRTHNFKIALVTPELHGTSPGLLGGEAHPHASTPERLFTRIEEILGLHPDAVCTDYPDEVAKRYAQLLNLALEP